MAYQGLEVFDNLAAAQQRVAFWQQQGVQNVVLNTVEDLTVYDFRAVPPSLKCAFSGTPLYIVDRLA